MCVFRFVSSLRARLKQLHPSVNCSLRGDHMVHVHFKEEIGIAELIPLVTTYIILFAYIYFSTRELLLLLTHSRRGGLIQPCDGTRNERNSP